LDAAGRARLQAALVRLQDGDRRAFDGVYAELWPLFQGLARKELGVEAEDVAQEALLKLFAHIDRFDAERDALAWGLGIVGFEIHTARNRHTRRRENLGAVAEALLPTADPQEVAMARDLKRAAAEVLGSLRASDIEVLERAARGERLPGPSFRKRLERALSRFRMAWRSTHELD